MATANGNSADRTIKEQLETEAMREMQGEAAQRGQQSAENIQDLVDDEDLLDKLLDWDISRGEDDELEERLKTELSRVYMTSNLDPHEVEKHQTWADQEAHLVSHEFPDRDSLATGTRGQVMYGEVTPAEAADLDTEEANSYRPNPPLTDEMERRLWSAADTKKAGIARSRRGWLIKRFTEFIAVGEQRKVREEDSGGFLSGLKDRLI